MWELMDTKDLRSMILMSRPPLSNPKRYETAGEKARL
jgi:hypothetical protein